MHNPAPTAQTMQQPVINPQPVMNPQPLVPSAFTPQPQPQQSLALYQACFSSLFYILYQLYKFVETLSFSYFLQYEVSSRELSVEMPQILCLFLCHANANE